MAADPIQFKLEGLDNLKRTLQALPNNIRRKALTKALRAAGKVVLDEAKARVPVLSTATKYRRSGTVKKAIKLRVSKLDKRQGNVGVFIGTIHNESHRRTDFVQRIRWRKLEMNEYA